MKISGYDGLRAHLPDYNDTQAKLLVARLPGITILGAFVSFCLDYSCRILYKSTGSQIIYTLEPFIPIFIPLVLAFGGTLLAQTGFRKKHELIKENRRKAYQKVAKPVFTGIGMVFGGSAYALLSHSALPFGIKQDLVPINQITTQFSKSLFSNWFGISWDVYLRTPLGIILLLVALATAFRAVFEFGIDTAALVYVYYPEDAKVVKNNVYSILRHPMYFAIISISLSGVFLYFSFYSLIHFLITIAAFAYHIFIKEEKELVERFGNSYLEYKNDVPALLIRPKNWGKLILFIIGK